MSPLELGNLTATGTEYFNIGETQERDLQTVFINIIKVLKEEMKKSHKDIQKTQMKSAKK